MRSTAATLSLIVLCLVVLSGAFPDRAAAKVVCLSEGFGRPFWTLNNIPDQTPLLAFGQVKFPVDRVPWLVFGLMTETEVDLRANNLFPTQAFECCSFQCEGTRTGTLISGRCTSPDTPCNRNCGSAGRVTPWNAQVFPGGTFPCLGSTPRR